MLDFIAIGLGPFNLSLASLLHEKTELHYLFFGWCFKKYAEKKQVGF